MFLCQCGELFLPERRWRQHVDSRCITLRFCCSPRPHQTRPVLSFWWGRAQSVIGSVRVIQRKNSCLCVSLLLSVVVFCWGLSWRWHWGDYEWFIWQRMLYECQTRFPQALQGQSGPTSNWYTQCVPQRQQSVNTHTHTHTHTHTNINSVTEEEYLCLHLLWHTHILAKRIR